MTGKIFRDTLQGKDTEMIDEKRIRLMTKISIYEKKQAEEDLKISGYYRKDYTSLNVWITLIWVTIGYGIAVGLFAICMMETLLEGLTILKMLLLMGLVAGFYIAILIMYGVGAAIFYRKKHKHARENMKKYYRDLSRLQKMYKKEKDSL